MKLPENDILLTAIKTNTPDILVCRSAAKVVTSEAAREILQHVPEISSHVLPKGHAFLGGGFIRTLIAKEDPWATDLDLFVSSEPDFLSLVDFLEKVNPKYRKIFHCPENLLASFKVDVNDKFIKIQIIRMEDMAPADMVSHFDFTACSYMYNGVYDEVYLHVDAVKDTLERKLNPNNICMPNATVRRIEKYARRGYFTTRSFVEALGDAFRNPEADFRFYMD